MAISQEQKQQVVELIQAGQPWSEAIEQVGLKVYECTVYGWVRCWRQGDEARLSDGRHGHVYKMTLEIQSRLKEYRGQAPHWPPDTNMSSLLNDAASKRPFVVTCDV